MPRRPHACLLLLISLMFSAAPNATQKPQTQVPLRPIAPLDLTRALDLYAGGRFDEAVDSVAKAGDEIGRHLRRHWAVSGQQWIDAEPAERPRRILAAAALALETEHLRAERGDWRVSDNPLCAAACVLDWAQLQLAGRGEADEGERAWYLAAAALAGGDRDWRYLYRPVDPARPSRVPPGLIDRALARFPGDSALRLEHALAAAGRFNIVIDVGRNQFPIATINHRTQDAAAALLRALVDDPVVGPEARLRLGYLEWTLGRDEVARSELTKAVAFSGDADRRYLGQFLLGWIAMARGDNAAAIPPLEAALAARPASQSAAVALGALELQRGDAARADAIARTSLDQHEAGPDPWRMFLYGHHPQWPARVAALRHQVKP